jgi:hypothetical protein
MKREWNDHSGRQTVWLSHDANDFDVFADQMTSRFGAPTDQLDGLDQRYWDFSVERVTIVLHGDTMAGVSIHVEDGSQDDLLRAIAGSLLKAKS